MISTSFHVSDRNSLLERSHLGLERIWIAHDSHCSHGREVGRKGPGESDRAAPPHIRGSFRLAARNTNFSWKIVASMCATWYIGRGDTHHVLIRWQIYPDWGDSWPWEHARFRSTSCDGGNAQRVHEQGPRTRKILSTHGASEHAHTSPRTPANLTDATPGHRRCSVKGSPPRSPRTPLCVTDTKCGRACDQYRTEPPNLPYSSRRRVSFSSSNRSRDHEIARSRDSPECDEHRRYGTAVTPSSSHNDILMRFLPDNASIIRKPS